MRGVAAVAAVTALVAVLYGQATTLWWTWDDAYLLRLAIDFPLRDYFLSADFWHAQPNHHFFPFFLTMLKAVVGLFSINAAPLYVLSLCGMTALGVTLYALLRLWLSHAVALSGALLVLMGPPMSELAARLSALHYCQAFTLAAAAAIAHVIGVRRQSLALAGVSAVLYLLALMVKEIVLPLPLVLALLPERRPVLAFAMHLEALAIFFALQTVMVGAVVSDYGFVVRSSELLSLVATTPWLVTRTALGVSALAAVGLATVLVIGIAPALRERRVAVAALLCLGLSVFGTLPVAKALEPRHAVLLWMTMAILFVIAAGSRRPLVVAAVVMTLVVNRLQWSTDFAAATRQSSEARAYASLGASDVLAYPSIPPAAMGELRWLKEIHQGGVRGTQWFYDDLFLCEGHGREASRFVSWHAGTQSIETITPEPHCERAKEAPMTLTFDHRRETLFWTFGPYRDGEWRVIMDGGRQSFAVPADDGFHLPGVRGLSLQVRYDSPEGWRTYSPVMALDFVGHPQHSFTR